MKFICQCQTLRQEIEYAMGFSTQKNSLSITSNVYLENSGDLLTIKATDLKMSFVSTIDVKTVVPGSTSVFCEKLVAVMKNLPEGDIEISEEGGKLTIRPIESDNNININLKTMDASKYPEIQGCSENLYFSLPQKDYIEMVDKTSFAVSEDNTRYFLTGVYMEKKDEKLALVATDGRRLAFISRSFEQEIPSFSPVIIPVKFLQALKSISSGEGVFSLAMDGDSIFSKIGNRTIS